MPPSTIRAVCFDMDGLMFNTEELYVQVGTELLRRRGRQLTQELLDRMTGRPSYVSYQVMIDEHGLTDTVADLQRETDEIFPPIIERELATMPGLLELLAALDDAEMPFGLATSSRRGHTQRVLDRFDLRKRFRFLLTSEDVANGKPDPEIYLTAAERLEVAPAEMLVLEDSEAGCAAAVAAGAYAVAVPGPHGRHFRYPGARLIADSLEDPRIREALGL